MTDRPDRILAPQQCRRGYVRNQSTLKMPREPKTRKTNSSAANEVSIFSSRLNRAVPGTRSICTMVSMPNGTALLRGNADALGEHVELAAWNIAIIEDDASMTDAEDVSALQTWTASRYWFARESRRGGLHSIIRGSRFARFLQDCSDTVLVRGRVVPESGQARNI